MPSSLYRGVIAPSFVVLPILIAIVKHRYWSNPARLCFLYLLLSALFNIISKMTAERHINNMPLLHLYTVLEFCLLCAIYKSVFIQAPARRLLTWLIVLFPLFSLVYIPFSGTLFSYNIAPRFLSSIILICFAIYFLNMDLNQLDSNQPVFNFIVVSGLLVYFASSSALFGLIGQAPQKHPINRILWNIHATFFLIMYLFFAVAYATLKKKQ